MPYSQFNYKKIRAELGIMDKPKRLFDNENLINPSPFLVEHIKEAWRVALFSEKSRSEALVFPILLEVLRVNDYKISLYSGPILNADMEKGLNGECDFILSTGEQSYEVTFPLFCMIEAEDNDIEKNIPQCIAQMEGARLINQRENEDTPYTMYGGVTTGTEWQFLKLEGNICWIDTKRYYINKLDELLGALQSIVVECLKS
jgi:hypothetical protein